MKTQHPNFEITHPDKVLFPESGITKNDLLIYYGKIADLLLPYLENRPLTLQRFPDGIGKKGFFQKNASLYFPDWIHTVDVRKVGGWVNHVVCNDKETLLYLVNQHVVTFHVPLSLLGNIEHPDRLIFDLDPQDDDFGTAVDAARDLRFLLENQLGLRAFLMTTGSTGLHVVVPLAQKENFDEVHAFAKAILQHICGNNPDKFTTAMRKNKRKGRLYIDSLRNSYAQTSVAPFSVRAFETAPVATPIHWNELDNKDLHARFYNIHNIHSHLERLYDPWKDFTKSAQSIQLLQQKLEEITNTH